MNSLKIIGFVISLIVIVAFAGYWLKIQKLTALLDINGNGMVDLVEAGAGQKNNFYIYDRNNDGSLQKTELLHYAFSSLFRGIKIKYRSINLPPKMALSNVTPRDVQTALDDMVLALDLPGAVLITGSGHGRHVWLSGAMSATSRVPVASASKWVSSAIVMRLVEDGVLALDVPISNYVSDIPEAWAAVTLRELMNFTAGAPEGHVLDVSPEQPYHEVFKSLVALKPHAAPGAEFTYGGITMQLAGYIAEHETGKDWNTLFKELVAIPLGMTSSTYIHPVYYGADLVINMPNVAAGLHTNAHEYFIFLKAMIESGKEGGYLKRSSIHQIEKDYSSKLYQNYRPPGAVAGWSYGLGVWCERNDLGECGKINSAGAYGSFPWIDRVNDSYGVLVTLGSIKQVSPFAIQLREMSERLGR